jgi:anaerobic selenocysteine-containing dehydrogenase
MGTNSAVTVPSGATKVVHAVCSHDCPDSCGILVTVDQLTGRALKMQGDPSHPVTRGFLCGKVAKYLDRVYSPDRLLYPMRRKAGVPKGPAGYGSVAGHETEAFERITWDEALDEIAARLGKIAAEFGPESVLPYSYAGTIGQLGYGSMDRRFFNRLGASQLDRTICSTAGEAAMASVYGIKLGTPPEDFVHAGLILVWGGNVHGNNVHLWPFIEDARRNGARLVVIDPYRTRTAALADEHLAIHPGTDAALALGMMHVIVREGLEDSEYISRCTAGFDELKAQVLMEENSPEAVELATGIAAETIVRLARAYAKAGRDGRGPAAIRLNYGIQRSEYGGNSARAVCMLPLLTGAWRYKGGGYQLSTSGAFSFNSQALRMPELADASPLGRLGRMVNMTQLGEALTSLGANSLDGPRVKALFVYNSNPAAIAPNQNDVLRGMLRDDLYTVVHEQFFTDTADYADVLLPAATFLETKDVQGAYGHMFAQLSERAIEPLGEARNNVALFGELAQRMGFTEECFRDSEDELIDQALTTDHPWFAGITRERLEREGHVPVQLPVNGVGEVLPFSTAEWFRTPSGRGDFTPPPVFIAPVESRAHAAGGEYPLEFLPRKADNYLNSTFANIPVHQHIQAGTAGVLEIHQVDALARGIVSGDGVEVFNARGSIALRAVVNEQVAAGVVSARLDWNKLSPHSGNVNALTSERLTDMGGGPTFYSTLVEVRKVEGPSL